MRIELTPGRVGAERIVHVFSGSKPLSEQAQLAICATCEALGYNVTQHLCSSGWRGDDWEWTFRVRVPMTSVIQSFSASE